MWHSLPVERMPCMEKLSLSLFLFWHFKEKVPASQCFLIVIMKSQISRPGCDLAMSSSHDNVDVRSREQTQRVRTWPINDVDGMCRYPSPEG